MAVITREWTKAKLINWHQTTTGLICFEFEIKEGNKTSWVKDVVPMKFNPLSRLHDILAIGGLKPEAYATVNTIDISSIKRDFEIRVAKNEEGKSVVIGYRKRQ